MTDFAQHPATSEEWDRPGLLSVVVQGGLSQGNLVETANHCRHWRALFPAAEIILALSGSDVVRGPTEGGVFTALDLVPAQQNNTQFLAAVAIIKAACDKVALAEPALPLPPIKSDSPKLNNMNLQLAAAQRGLALATGRFVLRIRADLIFLDRRFLGQYLTADIMPRGSAAVFHRRVLISWLFTLNPYTNERLPLHFSDWFHFGLTEDVRRLWQAPAITLADAMYYRGQPHAVGSRASERLFNTRLAVEQHVVFECFKDALPDLTLAYHNDQSSVDRSIDVLLDNFAICDLQAAGCVFEKYAGEFDDHQKTVHCLTREDWFALAGAREVDYRVTLAQKIEAYASPVAAETTLPLPRLFRAARFHSVDGRLLNGSITAVSPAGVLFWGPYTSLPRGRYEATLDTTSLEGRGTIVLRVSINSGKDLLALRVIAVEAGIPHPLTIPFDVPVAQANEVEVICRFEKLAAFAVSSVTFSERSDEAPAATFQQRLPMVFDASALSTRDGRRVGDDIVLATTQGTLFYGPYATILPGRYTATVAVSRIVGVGTLTLRVALPSGVVARRTLDITADPPPRVEIAFDVAGEDATTVELICDVAGLEDIAISGITLSERPVEAAAPSKKRLFKW